MHGISICIGLEDIVHCCILRPEACILGYARATSLIWYSFVYPKINSTGSASLHLSHASARTTPAVFRYATPACHSIHSKCSRYAYVLFSKMVPWKTIASFMYPGISVIFWYYPQWRTRVILLMTQYNWGNDFDVLFCKLVYEIQHPIDYHSERHGQNTLIEPLDLCSPRWETAQVLLGLLYLSSGSASCTDVCCRYHEANDNNGEA